jgi:hypothetical protein
MPRIFISYRRSDSKEVAGRIYDWLAHHFANGNVFKDVYNLEVGEEFAPQIRAELRKASVAIVIIGPDWVSAVDKKTGSRRLDDAGDLVRLEVEIALASVRKVIPLLVKGARMPAQDELPTSLQPLLSRQAIEIRPDPDFQQDMTRMLAVLNRMEEHKQYIRVLFGFILFVALAWGAVYAGRRFSPEPPLRFSAKLEDFEDPKFGKKPPKLDCTQGVDKSTAIAAQKAWASARNADVLRNILLPDRETKMKVAFIPPGKFLMGEGNKEEVVKEYICIGTHEVTNKEWRSVMKVFPPDFVKGDDDLPVVSVSWTECRDFCVELSRHLQTGEKARLPRELEWEYCCRAGTVTRFSFGPNEADLEKNEWFGQNSQKKSHKVGSKGMPNAWGLHDMHGNVSEWCEDRWQGGGDRVICGGSYLSKALECGATFRTRGAERGDATTGFRVVLEPTKSH